MSIDSVSNTLLSPPSPKTTVSRRGLFLTPDLHESLKKSKISQYDHFQKEEE